MAAAPQPVGFRTTMVACGTSPRRRRRDRAAATARALLAAPLVIGLTACADAPGPAAPRDVPATVADAPERVQLLLAAYLERFPEPPIDPPAWLGLGTAFPHRLNYAGLEAECILALREERAVERLFELGVIYTLAEEHARGMGFLLRVLDETGRDPASRALEREIAFWLAYNRMSALRYGEAVELFDWAAERDPGDPRVHRYRAHTQLRLGDEAAAEAGLRRTLELGPDVAPRPHDGGMSRDVYRQALLELAVLLEDRGDGEGARELLEELLEIDPRDLAALYRLGRLARAAGEVERAEELERRHARVTILDDMGTLHAGFTVNQERVELGLYHLGTDDAEAAEAEFRAVLDEGPTNPRPEEREAITMALVGLSDALLRQERLPEARATIEELRRVAPRHPLLAPLLELAGM